MKSFKQFDLNEDGQYTDRYTHSSAEDDNAGLFNVQDPASLQKLNGFVGALADKEYLQPNAAVEQLAMRMGTVGLNFRLPKIDGDKGNAVVEVNQFGGRYGNLVGEITMMTTQSISSRIIEEKEEESNGMIHETLTTNPNTEVVKDESVEQEKKEDEKL